MRFAERTRDIQSNSKRYLPSPQSVPPLIHLDEEARSLLLALVVFDRIVDDAVLTAFAQEKEAPGRFAGIQQEKWATALTAAAKVGLLIALDDGAYRVLPDLISYLTVQWRNGAGVAFEMERSAARDAVRALYLCIDRSPTVLQPVEQETYTISLLNARDITSYPEEPCA